MPQRQPGCHDFQTASQICRRDFIQAGLLGGLGLTLSAALQRQALGGVNSRAKSVILVWLQGGVSHHDTLDPKPFAPSDIRGEFQSISTRLPGVRVGEQLPLIAANLDKFAVIRSVTHAEAAHERGSMYMVEGRRPGPGANGAQASGNPQLGTIVAHEQGPRNGLPAFVSIPGNDFTSRFTGHGYLPAGCAEFRGYQAASLQPNKQQPPEKFQERLGLLDAIRQRDQHNLGSNAWDEFELQARDIIHSGAGGKAFEIDSEPDSIKQLYGIGGQGGEKGKYALIARRLIEAGTRYVTIGRHSWDHHSNIFPMLRKRLPSMDLALSGLVLDLEQRGMLDETLVVYMTEYGRTPKVNADGGRDHWPNAFSIAFAGAGIKTGQVLGSSDEQGARVTERPVSPEEIAATILHLVGINPRKVIPKPDGRPTQYVDHAEPIHEILA